MHTVNQTFIKAFGNGVYTFLPFVTAYDYKEGLHLCIKSFMDIIILTVFYVNTYNYTQIYHLKRSF